MSRIARVAPALIAAAFASTIFFHWAITSLADVAQWDWYHASFLSMFFGFWRVAGMDVDRDVLTVGLFSADSIRFLVPMIGAAVFLAITRTATVKRIALAVVVAALCAAAQPIAGFLRVFDHGGSPFVVELPAALLSLALCLYVVAPGSCWRSLRGAW